MTSKSPVFPRKDSIRDWQSLPWSRLLMGVVLAPLPALIIGLSALVLIGSDNLPRMPRIIFPAPQLYIWGSACVIALLYLNIISRFRGRISFAECLIVGGAAPFLIAEAYFAGYYVLEIGSLLQHSLLFPGVFRFSIRNSWVIAGAFLGLALMPAGILSGWIFWRLGVAPAVPRAKVEHI